eukprot:COSAG01_NODE_25139_length_754_cov_1.187786_1_plen_20_part_10
MHEEYYLENSSESWGHAFMV